MSRAPARPRPARPRRPVVTFPRMGTVTIVFRAILARLGVEVVLPPEVGPSTVALGVRHAPECACFPLKVNLGNYLEAARRGANTVIMVGGVGPCRLGYYAEVQREVLADLGLDLEMIVIEPPSRGWGQLLRTIRRLIGERTWADLFRALALGWRKLVYLDELDALGHYLRPRERSPGATSRAVREGRTWLDQAMTPALVEEAGRAALSGLAAVPLDEEREPVRVGVVGEVFMVLEPEVNLGCVERLGNLGAEVELAVSMSGWVRHHLLSGPFRPRGPGSPDYYIGLARPYVASFVGGEGQLNVGHTIDLARRGFDGVVHLAPFTCMPEIVARTVLNTVSRDYGIPVLTFFLDEHAAEAGVETRLEAFVDLLCRRRSGRPAALAGEV